MLENQLLEFQRELGEIKNLLNSTNTTVLEDEESYKMATKLDLTVARLIRILEHRQ